MRAAIAAAISAAAPEARVHAYQRYVAREADLARLYVSAASGRLNGWHVSRVGFSNTREYPRDIVTKTVTVWRITGFMALDDSAADGMPASWQPSEPVFDDQVDAVTVGLLEDYTLGGTVADIWSGEAVGAQGDDIGPVVFAGVLCHMARLSLRTVAYPM